MPDVGGNDVRSRVERGVTLEVDRPHTLTVASKHHLIPPPTVLVAETATRSAQAQPVTVTKALTLRAATSSHVAFAVNVGTSAPLSLPVASSARQGQTVTVAKALTLPTATSRHQAQAVQSPSGKVVALPAATIRHQAQTVTGKKGLTVGTATSKHTPVAVTVAKATTLPTGTSRHQAQAVSGGALLTPVQNLSVLAVNETVFASWQAPSAGTVLHYVMQTTGQADLTVAASGLAWETGIVMGFTMPEDGGSPVTTTVYAVCAEGTSPSATSGPTALTWVSPLMTKTAAGNRLGGIHLGATVRVLGGIEATIPNTLVSGSSNFTTSATVVGRVTTTNVSNTSGTAPVAIGCLFQATGSSNLNTGVVQSTGNGTTTGFTHYFCESDGRSQQAAVDEFGRSTFGSEYGFVGQFKAYWCYSHHAGHGYHLNDGTGTINFCAANNLIDAGGYHVDGIYTTSGSNHNYRGNHTQNGHGQTGGLIAAAFQGGAGVTVDSMIVTHNYLDGGGYAIYTNRTTDFNTNLTLNFNRLMRCFLTTTKVTLPANGNSVVLTIQKTNGGNIHPELVPAGGSLVIGMDDGTAATLTVTASSTTTITATVNTGGGGRFTPKGLTSAQLTDGNHTFNWHSGDTFQLNDVVFRNGNWYRSLTNANTGHDPATDTIHWASGPLTGPIRAFDSAGFPISGVWPEGGFLGHSAGGADSFVTGSPTGNVWDDDPATTVGIN